VTDSIDDRSAVLRQLFAELAVSSPMWTKDAARRYGVDERTIRRWCVKHHIGAKLAGDWFVSETKLKLLLVRKRTAP
jgi:transposase-like protein